MKIALVYYSLEGNTELVANSIAKQLNPDVFRIHPVKDYPKGNFSKYLWGGKSVVMGETPAIEKTDFNPANYDLVIIGTPIWASSFTPPIKTFLNENTLANKKVALFTCNAGGGTKKCYDLFSAALPLAKVITTLDLVDPKTKPKAEHEEQIRQFCNTCIM